MNLYSGYIRRVKIAGKNNFRAYTPQGISIGRRRMQKAAVALLEPNNQSSPITRRRLATNSL